MVKPVAIDIKIYTGPANKTELQSAIDDLKAKANFAILESLTDIIFPRPAAQDIPLGSWPKGRIFNRNFELRWELVNGDWQSILAVEKEHDINTRVDGTKFQLFELENYHFFRAKNYFLWDWNNARLGRSLMYECIPGFKQQNNKMPILIVNEYRDAIGYLLFWRYLELRYEE